MSNSEHDTIYSNLNLLETEELTDIYLNREDEFTELGFKVVQEILLKRLGSLPEFEPDSITEQDEADGEEPGAADENEPVGEFAPEFYQPQNIVRLEKWLYLAGRAALVAMAYFTLNFYTSLNDSIGGLFPVAMRNSFIVIALTILGVMLDYVLNVAVIVLPLIGIAKLLRILTQMELDSRSVPVSARYMVVDKPFVRGNTWLSKLLNWEEW